MTCLLNKTNLQRVKEIEKKAYPKFMQQYQDVDSIEDAYDEIDCDGDFFCHIADGWYILGCNNYDHIYIEDLARIRALNFSDLKYIINILKKYGDKLIKADCRSSTSYRLLKLAEKRGLIEIIEEKPWNWEGEKMYEIDLKIKPQSFKEWLSITESLDQRTKTALQNIKPKVFPDREALEKLIKQMEEEPNLVTAKDAFARVNAANSNKTQNKSSEERKKEKTIEIANKIKIPNKLLLSLQKEFMNGTITSPMLLSLTYFSSKGASDQQINSLLDDMNSLDHGKKSKIIFEEKPIIKTDNGNVKFDEFLDFSNAIHSLQVDSDYSNKEYFNPKIDVRPDRHKDLLVAKNGIYIYRGSNPLSCRLYGKGSNWCIASSTSATWYFTYRNDYKQTQYFIFDTNKDEDDPARITNPGVAEKNEYSEWVDIKNQSVKDEDGNGFGINGYSSIQDYKNYLSSKIGQNIDEILKPLELTEAEKKLKKYIQDYASAYA